MKKKNKNLKIRFFGGVGEIGKNMTALEYGNDIIIIDVGLTFPTDDMPGIDFVIPDTAYLLQNKEKVLQYKQNVLTLHRFSAQPLAQLVFRAYAGLGRTNNY